MTRSADPLTRALEEFRQSRRSGRKVTLRETLERAMPSAMSFAADARRKLLGELIRQELEWRWSDNPPAGGRGDFRLADCLAEFPDVPLPGAVLLDLIETEYQLRQGRGDRPRVAEYARRFPHLAAELQRRIKDPPEELPTESQIRALFTQSAVLSLEEAADNTELGLSASGADRSASRSAAASTVTASLAETLRDIRPFSQLSELVRAAVASHAEVREFEAGDVLVRQGEPADGLLIIVEGTADVTVEEHGRLHTIARLEPHTVVGEMAIVTHEARSASVVAASPGMAASINREHFEQLAGRYPRLSIALSELMAERVGTVAIDALCGKTIGRYRIERRVGRGAMGIVYAAVEQESGRRVALKMLRHDLAFDRMATQRFHQEAEIVRDLAHENIVQVYDEFSAFGTMFIAMELCDGPALGEVITHVGKLPIPTVRTITGQIAAGLLAAHGAGVAHRDLKPSNVLFTRSGLAKLADFGLARCLSTEAAALTAYGQIVGTPRYMAPEQISGERGDARADLYALGCMVYEMLAGHPLYRSEKFSTLLKERARWMMPTSAEVRPGLDPDLYQLLQQALAEEPQDRDVDLAALARWAAPCGLAALGIDSGGALFASTAESSGTRDETV